MGLSLAEQLRRYECSCTNVQCRTCEAADLLEELSAQAARDRETYLRWIRQVDDLKQRLDDMR